MFRGQLEHEFCLSSQNSPALHIFGVVVVVAGVVEATADVDVNVDAVVAVVSGQLDCSPVSSCLP